ncbi:MULTISPECIES: TonB-dependent receptor [Acidobacteriaceae]|uniref:TonB-dependent receptor n=1 Tax=Acidobacteriaceae TaxID=204434 RepID=UPI00131C2608|nr:MULTISPECIES: carboxypeptidase regulatory-like domain-containing protein [Acidobacteriaceae]MDW5266552.1 carboxypeptidase regulatory-like domain-containing protein [Edaphobacter sp.]
MFSFKTTKSAIVALFLISALIGILSTAVFAQSPTGTLHGTVSDPSGAVIPNAKITVTGLDGAASTAQSGSDGNYRFSKLVPGTYTITVDAESFNLPEPLTVKVGAEKPNLKNISLSIAVDQQQVTVSSQSTGVDVAPDNNAGAIVIKGKDLDALSDDPDQLQDELNALAGPAAGPSGGQIYIDGFTGGQLPPKSSIREIRINQNPFSAQYDKLGYGRIEILTKPGTDKLHGSFMVNGNDSAFNSLNTFVPSEPPYYSTFLMGNISGSLNSKSSWFMSAFQRNTQANSIVNAELLDASGQSYNFSQAVSNPQSRLDISPRLDLQVTPSNTLTIRYMYDRVKNTNDGVSQFALPAQGYNTQDEEQTLQMSDTQVLGARWINETRFQYIRDRDNQVPENTTPTVTVQGAFTDGGNNTGTSRDSQDHYELQNYTTAALGKHSINFGARLRLLRDSNYSTSGFNGNYTYSSLSAYAAHQPSQYEVTAGTPSAQVKLFDSGLFFQDDWRARSNLTLSYGLRYEGQNQISDHADFGPRFSFAWAPAGSGKKAPPTVIRGGYGWFFDRFQYSNVLQAVRQNGINQKQYIVKNPDFYENAPSVESLNNDQAAPTTYQISPHLKAPVNMQAAIGVEHQFGKVATLSVTYINSRGVHQLYSDNINAFLPGTYDSDTGTGVRPNGINENLYQYQSGGVYNQNQIITNFNIRAKKLTLFGFYLFNNAKADTSGVDYFPSNQFDPKADYGRSTFDVHNRFLLGGNYQAPFGVSLSPFLVMDSGTPFNITLGQDLNGDNQFNDRPSFATASSIDTMQTKYGNFDLNPAADATRIPYNLGNGPSQLSLNLRLSKSIGIGPRVERSNGGNNGGGPPPGGGGHGGGPGGGGPGGGLGPGGLSSSGGRPPSMGQGVPRKYSLSFTAMGRNVFNNVNLAAPVGVLSSTLFGKSNALAGGFFSSPSSNRSVDLQMMFNF